MTSKLFLVYFDSSNAIFLYLTYPTELLYKVKKNKLRFSLTTLVYHQTRHTQGTKVEIMLMFTDLLMFDYREIMHREFN